MGWQEYYKWTRPISFKDQEHAYSKSVEKLSDLQPEILNPGSPLTFVLGGFHPSVNTAESFKDFCERIHGNPLDRHIFLDMNLYPPASLDPKVFPYRIRAKLEEPVFVSSSIDFIFLDRTFNFMSPKQIQEFTSRIGQSLKRDGLIFATFTSSLFFSGKSLLSSLVNHTPTIIYTPAKVKRLCSSLKTVMEAEYEAGFTGEFTCLAFSRPDSILPQYQEAPYFFSRESWVQPQQPSFVGQGVR